VLAGVLSVEAGQDVKLGENWFVTPQLQLIWGDYHAKTFYDDFGSRFELLETPEVRGRLGLAAEHRLTDVNAQGGRVTTRFYGIGNLYYDFMGRNGIDVSGTPLTREQDELWGGVGLGASRDWLDGAYRVFTEADARAGLEHFADSYSVSGRFGVAARW
jgi:fibronectin-binding autotransporter adhesin